MKPKVRDTREKTTLTTCRSSFTGKRRTQRRSHLSRRAAEVSVLDGYWSCNKAGGKRVVYFKDGQIAKAYPKFTSVDLDSHHAFWKRATKKSVEKLGLPKGTIPDKTMKEIPDSAPKDEAEFWEYKPGIYRGMCVQEGADKTKIESWDMWTIKVSAGVIGSSGASGSGTT